MYSQDIVEAGKNLAGTYFANIEPNRNEQENNDSGKKKPKIKTISGISKYFYWEWPIEAPLAGYIQAKALPHIGSWTQFSPAIISNLCNDSIEQPQPMVSTHTQAFSKWTMLIPHLNDDTTEDLNLQQDDTTEDLNLQQDDTNEDLNLQRDTNEDLNSQQGAQHSVDKNFPLPKGWALKEKQTFGGKGTEKRMTKKVKSLLERFFLNGNLNPRDKLTAQEMRNELLNYVESNEIEEQDVPKVTTIQGWISRYAAAFKEQATKAALHSNNIQSL
ncbi:hypothetical protein Glove_99g287 [Diversispora epigaea]|uniref:Uncharacterized protein n=1 Tax=Diversispora epigaea TaxID=1348612 RepID=A0A397JAW3_9GLOM|nr:hypothetical protein Glove_99g287 [Diversispora epigaea]